MSRRLVLFDIDGTLLSAGGAGRLAVARAAAEVYGPVASLDHHPFGGKTDPQIVYEVMGANGWARADIEARLAVMLDRYLFELTALLPTMEKARLMPGVPPLLTALSEHPDVTLGILTGNLVKGASLKLSHFGLANHFRMDVGAYGSDHADRHELPTIAVERAAQVLGYRYAGKQVVIIGDTEHDVRCGRTIGVKAIAVATGGSPADELAKHAPDHLFADLTDTRAVVDAILS